MLVTMVDPVILFCSDLGENRKLGRESFSAEQKTGCRWSVVHEKENTTTRLTSGRPSSFIHLFFSDHLGCAISGTKKCQEKPLKFRLLPWEVIQGCVSSFSSSCGVVLTTRTFVFS